MRLLAPLAVLALALVAAGAKPTPAVSAPATTCRVPAPAPGWEAIFGYRSSYSAAVGLRKQAVRVGFAHLDLERVGCPRWAVALHGLKDRAQGREFAAEAKRAGFAVLLKCWPLRDNDPAWEAIFGSKLSQSAADRLNRRAKRVGFAGLKVLHEPCSNTWLVELDGIPTLKQAREFRAEAKRAGFAVTLSRRS